AFAEEGDMDRAISDFTQALKNEPRLVVAYVNRGNAYRTKKQYDQALADFTRALRLDPRNVLAYYNRAQVLTAQHAYLDAIADLAQVLQLDPNHPDAGARRDDARRALAQSTSAPVPPAATAQRQPVKAAAVQRPAPKAGQVAATPKRRSAE